MSDKYNILGELVSPEAIKSVQNLADAVQRVADNAEKAINTLNNNKSVDGSSSKGQSPAQQAKDIERLNALAIKLQDDLAKSVSVNQEKIRQEQAKTAKVDDQNYISKITNASLGEEKIRQEQAKTAKVEEQLQSLRENRAKRNTQLTDRQKVDIQNTNKQRKLEAQAISQTATELQRLYAQQELANREAQKMAITFGVESKQFGEASIKAKNLTTEIIKLETATGKLSGKATNANYATFQLTQVMRELPNFAMSARIGFMSLSNNLPQLVDGFTMLKDSVDATGKKLGSMGALKTFASSLLSLNTVVIIATTLMLTYGDSIVEYISSLFTATDMTEAFDSVTKRLIKTMGDKSAQSTKNVEDIMKLKVAIDAYSSGTVDASRKEEQARFILSEYNNVLGRHYGIKKNVNDVINDFNKNAEKYIDYTIRMVSSEQAATEAADELLRARQANETIVSGFANGQNIEDIKKFYKEAKLQYQSYAKTQEEGANKFVSDAQKKALTLIYNPRPNVEGAGNGFYTVTETKQESLERDKTIKTYENKLLLEKRFGKDRLNEIIKNMAVEEVATFKLHKAKKDALELYQYDLEKANTKGSSSTVQHARIKFVAEEFYNEQRIQLLKNIAKYEEDINKERLDGTLNDYKVRVESNEKWIETQKVLAESDLAVARETAREKAELEINDINKIRQDNYKKLSDGKITQKELTDSEIVNFESISTVRENLYIQEKELKDKMDEKMLESSKKYAQNDRKIMQDLYNDRAYLIDVEERKRAESISQQSKIKSGKIADKTTGEIAVSSFSGFNKDTSFDERKNAYETAKSEIDSKAFAVEEKLKLVKKGSEEEKQLQRELDEWQRKGFAETARYEIDIEVELQKKLRDTKLELAQKTEELLLKIAKNGFENQLKALDKRNEKEKAINEERYKDVEDREKAGVITKQEAEDEKARIDVYAKGQEEQIAREKLEIQKKQFYFEQGVSLAKVAMSTGQAIMQSFAQAGPVAGIPLAIAMGALGAVQAALILAQQPPAFKDGGDMPYDGLALVGDGGKNEVLITPDGKIGITPNKDTYMHLEAGTKILPDVNKVNMDGLMAILNVENGRMSTNVLESEIRGLRKDIRNKKTATFSNVPMMRSIEFAKNIEKRAKNL